MEAGVWAWAELGKKIKFENTHLNLISKESSTHFENQELKTKSKFFETRILERKLLNNFFQCFCFFCLLMFLYCANELLFFFHCTVKTLSTCNKPISLSCEQVMNKSWTSHVMTTKSWASNVQVMDNSWKIHEYIMNTSWTSDEQIMYKWWISDEQVGTMYYVTNKSLTSCEQVIS